MSLPPEEEIAAQLPGAWRLPITDDYSVIIALTGNGQFLYTISAATAKARALRLLLGDEIAGDWHVRSRRPRGSSFGSSAGSVRFVTSSVAPPHQRGGGNSQDEVGPFLVLNVTRVPNSILNLSVAGFHVKFGEWLSHIRQVAVPDYIKILDLTQNELKVRGYSGVEVWHKIQR
jgi:hypothetical protein